MPGFIDAHAHWNGAWSSPFKVFADYEMFVNLAFGMLLFVSKQYLRNCRCYYIA